VWGQEGAEEGAAPLVLLALDAEAEGPSAGAVAEDGGDLDNAGHRLAGAQLAAADLDVGAAVAEAAQVAGDVGELVVEVEDTLEVEQGAHLGGRTEAVEQLQAQVEEAQCCRVALLGRAGGNERGRVEIGLVQVRLEQRWEELVVEGRVDGRRVMEPDLVGWSDDRHRHRFPPPP